MRNLTEEMPYAQPAEIRRQKALEALENYIQNGWALETEPLIRYFSNVQLADMVLALHFRQKGLESGQADYIEYEEIEPSHSTAP